MLLCTHSLDTMTNPKGKKTTVPASKKRKGAALSSGPTAEIRHPFLQFPPGPQEELFQILRSRPLGVGRCIDWTSLEQIQLADAIWALLTTDLWGLFFEIIESTYLELTLELCSTFHLQVIMTEFDDPKMVQFYLSGLVRQLSIPEFGVALGLYIEKFMDDDDFVSLQRHIHYSLSNCWKALVPTSTMYDPSRSKASALVPSLRYLHTLLAHTLTGRRESTGVINTCDAYFLRSMVYGQVFDLAYFITLTIRHQTEWYRKGVISIDPYVTRLAWYICLLNMAAQASSLSFISQMSPQGISSMLHMRMIK
ncbi:hypothetical protein PVK06_002423 [Gossypium arboreum]|uniref:Arabidopsis retrotransposon Orf1 C-terminal domain-containing protein n=1 Tax=Gossypium arboreum TaxID=29729 RepID=A0ABR0R4N7_GOSAR|nr:hypothetical protein PVK06_002423 [Gossypium arboreum]